MRRNVEDLRVYATTGGPKILTNGERADTFPIGATSHNAVDRFQPARKGSVNHEALKLPIVGDYQDTWEFQNANTDSVTGGLEIESTDTGQELLHVTTEAPTPMQREFTSAPAYSSGSGSSPSPPPRCFGNEERVRPAKTFNPPRGHALPVQASVNRKTAAKNLGAYAFGQVDPDEEWSTLPSRKKKKDTGLAPGG